MIDEDAIARATAVLRSGRVVQGPEVEAFERALAERTGRAHAVCVSSGTAALELACRALELEPGSEILVPSLSWPSPAHVARMLGLEVVLTDVDPAEWNARGDHFAARRTERTRAAIVIDQFGFPARQGELRDALEGLFVIEDAACALGSQGELVPCGGFGVISCLSFHPRKIVTTGEGGACLTDDDALAARLRALRNHGQSAPGTFVLAGGNHRLTDFAAALGASQLPRLDQEIDARRAVATELRDALPFLAFQAEAPGTRANVQTFGALLPDTIERDGFLARLRAQGVEAGKLSYALGRIDTAGALGSFPVAEAIADRGVALPMFGAMDEATRGRLVRCVEAAR
jgi:perosamine synthetase